MKETKDMYIARIALIALGLSFATTSHAFIEAKRCVGCITDGQWRTVAAQQTFGSHYLYNFPGGEIRLYEKDRVPLGSGHTGIAPEPWGIEIIRHPVPPRVQATFDAATQLWAISPTLAYSDTLNLDPFGPDVPQTLRYVNAFDVVATDALQNDLSAYIDDVRSNNQFVQFVSSVAAGSYVGIKFDETFVTYSVRVTFSDGSSVLIRLDLTHGQQAYYVEGQSRDSNNNPIVEPGQVLTNRFRFNVDPDGFDEWRDYTRDVLGWGLIDGTYCAKYSCGRVRFPVEESRPASETGSQLIDDEEVQVQWECHCYSG